MHDKDGTERILTLWDRMKDATDVIAFVARYMHQPLSELEALSVAELRDYFDTTKAMVIAELGKKTPVDPDLDGEWV